MENQEVMRLQEAMFMMYEQNMAIRKVLDLHLERFESIERELTAVGELISKICTWMEQGGKSRMN